MIIVTNARMVAETFTARAEGGLKPSGTLGDANRAFKGINQSTYDRYRDAHGLPRQDVARASDLEVAAIYDGYWTRYFCDRIALKAPVLAIAHFDCEFNGGGTVVLETTVGQTAPERDATLTVQEVDALIVECAGPGGEVAVVTAYLQNRLNRFRSLKNAAAEPGWEKRLNQLALYLDLSWRVS